MTQVTQDPRQQYLDKAQDINQEQIQQQRQLITIISVNDKDARDIIYYLQDRQSIDLSKVSNWKKFKNFLWGLPKVSNPNSSFRIFWELISMIFIFIQMIQIPLVLTYSVELSEGFLAFNQFMDVFFYIDMILNFKLAYYHRGEIIFDRKLIAINYLKLWFWLDFLAVLPYDQMFSVEDSQTQLFKIVRLFKFIKIIRLLRVLKISKILQKLEESFTLAQTFQAMIQFLKIACMILSIAHWIACIWNIIEYTDEQVSITWMQKYGIADADWGIKYISAFYFSVTTMITVGYGDINANTQTEMIFAVFAMVLASAIFGYSMSSFMQIIEGEDEKIQQQRIQNSKIVRYIRQKSIPKELQSRVKNYLEWLAGSAQIARNYEQYVLKSLSANLKTEIVCLLNGRILHKVQLFSKEFTPQLINKLVYVLNEQILGPEEYVFKENSLDNDKVYFIQNGQINICLTQRETLVKTLQKGEYFGEIGFFGRKPRNASAKTVDFVNVMSLKRSDLWEAAKPLESDLLKLYFMKDCLEVENNFKPLKLRCYICDRPHHIARNCTVFHYRASRKNIIFEYFSHQNSRMRLFQRKSKREKININQIQEQIQKYQINQNRNEKQQKNITNNYIIEDVKIACDIDHLKEYSDFYNEFNITNVAQNINFYANFILLQMEEEKKKLKAQLRQNQKRLKNQTLAPRQSKITLGNLENLINLQDNYLSLSSKSSMNCIERSKNKSKRLLDLQSQKQQWIYLFQYDKKIFHKQHPKIF
ncbi:unnamed protein product (macronuclear) [Paramecium tetraurelia]|uniref:Cyclic nucleotide-binding domain-containing protein n=1 Tax=Paramecium tetraurelia TaxID=5888 RepID=A0DEB9_PARTE|nr:uncharacterized protein GSPATT00016212001 [Paramecium tetraurelia]CAK81386.1 unnamed protein product [Paramecium tetraurelia]|eukprot:XP_001448783.1 hypothetical protein (macronuclear) [Paramecium tetraurelia strain d4-2]